MKGHCNFCFWQKKRKCSLTINTPSIEKRNPYNQYQQKKKATPLLIYLLIKNRASIVYNNWVQLLVFVQETEQKQRNERSKRKNA
jgi:hypothetical protein